MRNTLPLGAPVRWTGRPHEEQAPRLRRAEAPPAATGAALLLLGALTTACGSEVTVPEEFSTLTIVAETTGDTLDFDGYSVAVGGEVVELPANGSVTIEELSRGEVIAEVDGVAVNCSLDGEASRSLTLDEDSEELSLSVSCLPALLGKVVFDSDRDGDAEIYVMNPDGSDVVQLTDNEDRDAFPSVSPDGTTIAFMRRSSDGFHIYTMKPDGSGTTRITAGDGLIRGMPEWSPDGSRIAFYQKQAGESSHLYLMDTDGSNLTRLTSSEETNVFPTWSPDGTRLAFASIVEGRYQIRSINADGTGLTQLSDHDDDETYPSWSPDGARIVFSRKVDSAYHLFLMGPDGSDPIQLTFGDFVDAGSAWSPDGESILFSSNRTGFWELYSLDPSTGEMSESLTPIGHRNFWPRWSPPR